MHNRRSITLLLGAFAAALTLSPVLRAQEAGSSSPATTAAAPADLSGLWTRLRDTAPQHGDYGKFILDFGNSDSGAPMTPWAAAKYKVNHAKYAGSNPQDVLSDPVFSCFPPGVPRIYLYNFPLQVAQIPGQVLMLFEYDHFVRRIYTDGRGHDPDAGPLWMGDSIGHWEGNTLVVDTTSFNDKTLLDRVGRPHSDALHVTERMRRLNHDYMEIAFTVDDPKAYTKPWGAKLIFELKPDWKIMENVCEDNASFVGFNKAATQSGASGKPVPEKKK